MTRLHLVSSPSRRAVAAAAIAWLAASPSVLAGQATPLPPAPPAVAGAAATQKSGGPAWGNLSPAQQQALAPLQRDWPGIDASRKAKWLEVAAKFPKMPPEERARVQERMAAWSRLSPAERGEARIQFQQARQLAPDDRQAHWDAYQALPEATRRELAQRTRPAALASKPTNGQAVRPAVAQPASKMNVVEAPKALTPKAVTPTVVQARPGATTTLLSQPATPPMHQQTGLPKIAATKEFVQPNTLLPKRGPQGAAVRAASASASASAQ
jgi:Protein of unknown function (DUF3106)